MYEQDDIFAIDEGGPEDVHTLVTFADGHTYCSCSRYELNGKEG